MVAGKRVFTDATQSSQSGCKKLGKHGSRKGAVRRSAHLITDYKGDEYERVEYTPYGEYWIEKRATENKTLPFKFTGKERDEETGLYYYGARYLDAKTSRWLTTDPALSDYIPMAPTNDTARKHNQNLPGMGGIYNTVNFHLYHYAGNNPVKYIDPTGMFDFQTLGKGVVNLYKGIGKISAGIGILAACGVSEAISAGTATPLAVIGGILGGGLMANGWVQASIGSAEIIAGLVSDNSEETSPLDNFPDTLNQILAVPIDATIELITKEESTVADDIAKELDKIQPPSNTVLEVLVENPAPLY